MQPGIWAKLSRGLGPFQADQICGRLCTDQGYVARLLADSSTEEYSLVSGDLVFESECPSFRSTSSSDFRSESWIS